MLRDIFYHLNRQIEVHMMCDADRDDLRILMSDKQKMGIARLMAEDDGLITYPGEEQEFYHRGQYRGIEIVKTIEDMPLPLVVRLASI